MQSLRSEFARNLRRHRERSGLSQENLALICGMDRSAISLLECEERTPRLETVVKLKRGLDLPSISDLLDGIG